MLFGVLIPYIGPRVRAVLKRINEKINYKHKHRPYHLAYNTVQNLRNEFSSSIDNLEEMIGCDLSTWRMAQKNMLD